MDEALRTTASPATIWVIVVVMSIFTAILVSAASIADSWQVRADRREGGVARLRGSVGDLINHDGALGPDMTSSGASQSGTDGPDEPWSQTREEAGVSEPALAGGRAPRVAVPGPRLANEQQPVQPPSAWPRPMEVEEARRHQSEGTDPAAEAPTLPDLPAVPGRQATPGQRSGDSDRAVRTQAGSAAPEGDDPGQR
jgi:hypothetical protein